MSSGSRDAQHVERQLDDGLALEREHHDDGEEQRDQRDAGRCAARSASRTSRALGAHEHAAGEEARGEGDAEVDGHALGDLADGDVHDGALRPSQVGSSVAKKYA
jgi:hypothetical protein